MTADKYQPKHQCPLEERVNGIEGEVGVIKRITVGIYDLIVGLNQTTDAIYDAVVKSNHRDYDPIGDDSFLDDLEE